MKKNKFVILLIVILIPLAISFCLSYWVIKNEEIFWPNYVKIEKIEPTISWPTMSESDNTILEGDKISLSNNGSATYVDENDETQSVDGVFSIEDTTKLKYEDGVLVSNDLEKSVYFTIKTTFTPNDTSKYSIVQKSDTIYMLPVARIGSNYYGTIKKALDSGASDNNSNTIYVIVGSEKGGRSPYIRSNITIAQNDKLIIPFDDNGNYENREGINNFFADSDSTKIDKYRKNNVTTLANVNITISKNAVLIIGGTLGSESQGLQGHTSGDYCQLTLGSNSKILNSGTLNVLGYIKETNKTANSQIENLYGSYMILPMVIYDYRGGQSTAGVFENNQGVSIFPFNIYDFPNVQPTVVTNHGAKVDAYVDMFTGYIEKEVAGIKCRIYPRHNLTTINYISASNAFINLSNGSKFIYKYNTHYVDNIPVTVDDKINGTSSLIIDGNASLGVVTLSIRAAEAVEFDAGALGTIVDAVAKPMVQRLLNRDLSTEGIYFPIPWKFSITLRNGDFNLDNYVKLLTGSSLTIDHSSILNVSGNSKLAIYDSFIDAYPTTSLKYPEKDSAKLVNNGKLVVDGSIGGTILNASNNAILELNTSNLSINDCHEGWATMSGLDFNFTESNTVDDGNGGKIVKTIVTKGYFDESVEFVNLNTGFYTSVNRTSINNYGYWTDSGDYEILEISFVADGINETLNIKKVVAEPNQDKTEYFYIINEEYLPKPTKNHYTFEGWYTEQSLNNSADGIEISSNITLYAKFVETTYKVNYEIKHDDCTSISLVNNNRTEFDINTPIILSLPTDGNLKFDGWYEDESYTKKITQITVNDITTGNSISVYGKFTNKKQYNVSFVAIGIPDSDIVNYSFDNKNIYEDVKITTILPNTDTIDEDITEKYKYYFIEWYLDSELTQVVDRNKQIKDYANGSDLKVTFYSKWQEKCILTIKAPDSGDGGETSSADIYVYNETNSIKDTYNKNTIFKYYLIPNIGRYKIDKLSKCEISSPTNIVEGTEYTISSDVTIVIKTDANGCVASGTLVTLADGTQIRIEDLKIGDEVLSFNHETGLNEITIIDSIRHENNKESMYEIIELKFDDGQILKIVDSHGLFDLSLNKYVFISKENASNFIGHEFYSIDEKYRKRVVILEGIECYYDTVKVYSPISRKNLNLYANGLLTMTPAKGYEDALFNIFEYDSNQKYDIELMKQDIEKYGLYTYEDFEGIVPEHVFNNSIMKYLKVSVGKGYITYEEILKIYSY